jgi:hypothetical protein
MKNERQVVIEAMEEWGEKIPNLSPGENVLPFIALRKAGRIASGGHYPQLKEAMISLEAVLAQHPEIKGKGVREAERYAADCLLDLEEHFNIAVLIVVDEGYLALEVAGLPTEEYVHKAMTLVEEWGPDFRSFYAHCRNFIRQWRPEGEILRVWERVAYPSSAR